jgi:hypothetical protein
VEVNYPVAGGFAAVDWLKEALNKPLRSPGYGRRAPYGHPDFTATRSSQNLSSASLSTSWHGMVKSRNDQLPHGVAL